jgi:hypothetical protein
MFWHCIWKYKFHPFVTDKSPGLYPDLILLILDRKHRKQQKEERRKGKQEAESRKVAEKIIHLEEQARGCNT